MGTYLIELDSFTDGFLNSKLSEWATTGRMKLKEGRKGVIRLILNDYMRQEIPNIG